LLRIPRSTDDFGDKLDGFLQPVEEPLPGLKRYRIASKIVKGQPLGGTGDEWVVIELAFRQGR
jgi:hypothetical protein